MNRIKIELTIETHGDLFADDYPCRLTEGRVSFLAHETGPLKIIQQENNVSIIRESGHQYFRGRGEFPYTSPRYYIGMFNFRLARRELEEIHKFSVIYTFKYMRNQQKVAKEIAFELFENLKEQMEQK